MTIVSISRKKICDAIEKEPTTTLAGGSWYSDNSENFDSKVKSRECSVCAVGAVMRNALLDRNQGADRISDAACAATYGAIVDEPEDIQVNVENGYYMAALSCFFEDEYSKRILQRSHFRLSNRAERKIIKGIKKDCIAFVKKNFPAKIEIDIDGAKPAKDVKVVKED